jgi:hypothetical protein
VVILVTKHRETVRNEIRSVSTQATVMKTGITEVDYTIKIIHCKTKRPPQYARKALMPGYMVVA